MMRKALFRAAVLLVLLVGLAPLVAPARADPPVYAPQYDVNGDGRIDIVDIMLVVARWKTTGTWSCPCYSLPQTGQSPSFRPGDDGDLQKGVAWPNPRFTDNGDGTVTDNLTGLIWLKNANCFGEKTWEDALSAANTLNNGECGLSDGSAEHDWRLPNLRELQSLINYGVTNPVLSDTTGTGQWTEGDPFTNVKVHPDRYWYYWSSTTLVAPYNPEDPEAWVVGFREGQSSHPKKRYDDHYVWPVRDELVSQVQITTSVPANLEYEPLRETSEKAPSRMAGMAYDPVYDINRDGKIDIVDIMLVAARWKTTGTWSCPCYSLPQTGQTVCYTIWPREHEPCECGTPNCPAGQDGDLQKGRALPNPRFTDNGDGTVTDNLTGLIWLKNANCMLLNSYNGHRASWGDALEAANELADGHCGLSDRSVAGDWRLPNVNEFKSLFHHGFGGPALSDTTGTEQWTEGDPFTNIELNSNCYWTSTTNVGFTAQSWIVFFYSGQSKTQYLKQHELCYVWPVRDGQSGPTPPVTPTATPQPLCDTVTEIPTAECEALVALYNSTDGANWRNSSGWLDTNTPCNWHGVVCNAGRVTELSLYGNQLSGNIPPKLGNLTNLHELILGNNQLSGSIPPELGNLANLQRLYLYSNQLSGDIPPELGNLASLEDLNLWSNQLSGSIPPELGNLANLQKLDLLRNQLSGNIPPKLGNLTNLSHLYLGINQLSSNIPPELGNLADLEYLDLYMTQLSGALPGTLTNLTKLDHFWFHDTDLCEPADAAFQTWLAGISSLSSTGVICP